MATTLVTIAKVAGPIVEQMQEVFRSWDAAVRERCVGAERAFAEVRELLVARGTRRKLGRKIFTSEEYRRRLAAYIDPARHQRSVEQMVVLRDALEAHADLPPVVFFRKYVDPWTIGLAADAMRLLGPQDGEPLGELIAPFLQALRSREGWSDPIEMALFTPTAPGRLKEVLGEGLAWYHPTNPDRGHDWFERRELYQALAACAEGWAELLAAQRVDSATVLAFQPLGGSWSDEEVAAAVGEVPSWFVALKSGWGGLS
jgi:hypothetical protein